MRFLSKLAAASVPCFIVLACSGADTIAIAPIDAGEGDATSPQGDAGRHDGGRGTSSSGGSARSGSAGSSATSGSGGSSGTSGTSGSSGTAGTSATEHDAGSQCTDPATDCPAPTSSCTPATCTAAGKCGTSQAPKGTACSNGGGTVCDDAGNCVACNDSSDCPTPKTVCQVANCAAHACSVTNAPAETTCDDDGGKVCDGDGVCVACVAPTDCPASTTVCAAPACNDHACGDTDAPLGTPCTDGGGVVCNGTGTCVASHCADGIQDGGETGVDCGGSECDMLGKTCANGKDCDVAADCTSGECTGGTCVGLSNGTACTKGGACASGDCADGVCCNTACKGTCQACTMALTGQPSGTCADVTAGTPAPAGQCTAVGVLPCGNNGNCAAGGVCELAAAGTTCGQALCVTGFLSTPGTCNGTGTCSGTTGFCPGNFGCENGTTCWTSCTTSADCRAGTTCHPGSNPGGGGTCS